MKYNFIGKKWDTNKHSAANIQQALDDFVGPNRAKITVDIVNTKKVRITVERQYSNYGINPGDTILDIVDESIILGRRPSIPGLYISIFNCYCPFSDVENNYNSMCPKSKLTLISQSDKEFVAEIEI